MEIGNFYKYASFFTKSPLGIIALFIILVYGFASLIIIFAKDVIEQLTPLIYFLTLFPVLVLFGFLWLVAKHHKKLYGPSDFKNEDNFMISNQLTSAASLAIADTKDNDNKDIHNPKKRIEKIVKVISNFPHQNNDDTLKNRILWVDDRPDNNVYERFALEAQGIEFSLAVSTNEALELIKKNEFSIIISDMGRKEGTQEGYVLLQKLRDMGNHTPFIIYASSNSREHKDMAKQKGAIGSTNRGEELFKMVMEIIANNSQ